MVFTSCYCFHFQPLKRFLHFVNRPQNAILTRGLEKLNFGNGTLCIGKKYTLGTGPIDNFQNLRKKKIIN